MDDWSPFIAQITLYQDDHILIVNKPSGLLSVPGKGDLTDSLLTRLVAAQPEIKLIHRLDRDTSGVMVFARSKAAQSHISKQFQARETEKKYQAIVLGALSGSGEVDVPVRYDPTRPPMHIVDLAWAKQALTLWQALPPITISDVVMTPIWLKPVTGRSHQLRVHMQHLGHPIVSDPLYAPLETQTLLPRLALHAYELKFFHPESLEPLCFQCPAEFGHELAQF